MTIRCIYRDAPPAFPPTDQHPDAVRFGPFVVDGATMFVDAIGTAPTLDEIRDVLGPPRTFIDYTAFRARWNDTEKSALHGARAASWQIDDYIGLAQSNGYVDLTVAGEAKAAIVAAGVLTQERADEIFLPEE